ncbi:MAG TPA: hypothetical protein VKG26_16755 [Bacteroidia bacterium]|nr:hypothetical protein [Bacteroidia bacterium]
MKEDDKKIIFEILSVVDTKQSKIMAESKGKDIDEIIALHTDKEKYKQYGNAAKEHHKIFTKK